MIQFIIMLASLMGVFTTIVQEAFECLSLWRKENITLRATDTDNLNIEQNMTL